MPTRVTLALSLLVAAFSPAWAGQRVVVLTINDTIQPASLRYLERGLDTADRSGAAVTILELNTPGGLLTSLRQMTTALTSASRPVVVYVTPSGGQAASAGFFLLVSADLAAMAPGTNAGAAHPVGGEGQDLSKTISEKVTNDAAALIRSLAEQRGRSSEWAEKAVRESLSYTEREALEKKLIDIVAADRGELLKALNGREVKRFDGRKEILALDAPEIVTVGPSAADRLLSAIAHPNIAYLLLMLGVVGIYFELAHPGAILPGVLGGVAMLLALFALSVLPVNYVGVLLILLAIVFFIAEVKVTSYGLLAAAGLVSFIIGSLMLVESPIPAMRVGLSVILPAAAFVAAVVIFLLTRVLRTHRLPPITGAEGLLGEEAEVVVALAPGGKVFVHGEYWDAVAREPVPAGARVRVARIEGKRLWVEAPGELSKAD
ncbi:MAG: nodulation protein NfeD [Acidobacteriota bacterium]